MDTLRIFLHVISASIWVGGQLTLAAMVPTLRGLGGEAPRRVAQAFARISWPAYAVAVVTGLWNVVLIPLDELAHPWIELKVLAVAVSGGGAALHQVAGNQGAGNQVAGKNRALVAAGGATALVGGVAAMYLGVLVGPVG